MAHSAAADLAKDAAAHTRLIEALRRRELTLCNAPAVQYLADFFDEGVGKSKNGAINAPGPGGMPPLIVSCLQGNADDVALLLRFGADPSVEGDVWGTTAINQPTRYRHTPLNVAVREEHAGIVAMLIAHKDIDIHQAASDYGSTPFYISCLVGNVEIANMLLAQGGVDVNVARTDSGSTPLCAACERGHAAVVKLLLAQDGVDVNQGRTRNGGTPLYNACEQGHAEVVELLLSQDGIDVNKVMQDNVNTPASPLKTACGDGYTEIVRMLLAQDAIDINIVTTADGETPLYAASCAGHTEVVMLLLARNEIDVHRAENDSNATPLHGAAWYGYLQLVQLLVVYGARLNTLDNDGKTPADLATSQGHPMLAEWLDAVAGWSQFRVAAGCRLHRDTALLLRQGRVDPDDPSVAYVRDIMAARTTTALEGPDELPWQNGQAHCNQNNHPLTEWKSEWNCCVLSKQTIKCNATILLVAEATRGWHRTSHRLYHKRVRMVVFTVMVVAARLVKKDNALIVVVEAEEAEKEEAEEEAEEEGLTVAGAESSVVVANADANADANAVAAVEPAAVTAVGVLVHSSGAASSNGKNEAAVKGGDGDDDDDPSSTTGGAQPLSVLPVDIWMYSMQFILRSWWDVE